MNLVNRRKSERKKLEGIEVYSRTVGGYLGKSMDISLFGVFVLSERELPVGAKILLELNSSKNNSIIKALGEVKRNNISFANDSHQGKGMGIEFIHIYEVYKSRLLELINKNGVNSDEYNLGDFFNIPSDDLFFKTESAFSYLKDMEAKGYNRYRTMLLSSIKNRVNILDQKTNKVKELIMMGSSDYLGLINHPKVKDAIKIAIEEYGMGSSSAPLLAGSTDLHFELEEKLAKFLNFEEVIIFPTGYMANMGCISALVDKDDLTIFDSAIHASVLDGCKLSGGSFRIFKHSDIRNLSMLLSKYQDKFKGKLIVVEGVYSMDGDLVPLPDILGIAKEFGAKIMVDDAHGIGVMGENGRGTVNHFGLDDQVDIVMGSLSKSLGCLGGFVASSKEVIHYLRYFSKPYFYAVNLPPAIAASALAALEIIETEPKLIKQLWKNTNYFKEKLTISGVEFNHSETPIFSVTVGEELRLKKVSKYIHEQGVYVDTIPYPAVPKDKTRIRMRVTAMHKKSDLDEAVSVIHDALDKY